jgi:hypothetical protein
MTLARLLAAALVLCSLSAFAQDPQAQNSQPSNRPSSSKYTLGEVVVGPILGDKRFFWETSAFFFAFIPSTFIPSTGATVTEPWRIFPDSPSARVSGRIRFDQVPADQPKLEFRFRRLLESQIDRLSGEGPTCYAIRSYMVACDSKDSDSTHPAGYSTCQPVGRYGVKTITSGPEPADR